MPSSFKLTTLIAFFLFAVHISHAQQQDYIITKHFLSVEDGLASREVFCGLQDNDGFLWFGTRNGLNRYDGKNFKLFTKQKDGLAENRVYHLAKDNNNHLFIAYEHPGFAGSVMKIEVMDLQTNKINSLKTIYPNLPFDERSVYWVDNDGDDLCFLVSNPFQFWKFHNGKFELKCEMQKWNSISDNPETLLSAKGGYHTTTGSSCFFRNDYAALFIGIPGPVYAYTAQGLFAIYDSLNIFGITPDNQVLLKTPNKVKKLSGDGTIHDEARSFIPPFSKEGGDIFWQHKEDDLMGYTSVDGLFLYDYSNWYKLLPPREMNISSGTGFYSFFKDRQNNIWVCTANGLIKLKIERNPFRHYFSKAILNDSSENQVRGIYAATNVYANCWNKTYSTRQNKNIFTSTDGGILYGLTRFNNSIFIGTRRLYRYNENTNELSRLLDSLVTDDIWAIDSLSTGKLLLGCANNMYVYDVITAKAYSISYAETKIPKANFVYRFIHRKDKSVWAVAQNGLYLLDADATTVTGYWGKQISTTTSNKLPFDLLLDAYEDSNGIVWFATNGEGLFRWDKIKNDFRQFNTTAGLPSDILYRMEADEYGNLWISTDNGLVRFNTVDFKTNTYNITNGISHNEFNRGSSFKAADGRLFFGGLNGVNAFYPKDLATDTSVANPALRIIAFNQFSEADNKMIERTAILIAENKIVLQPGDRLFNLEFQLLDFADGKENYAYRIEGIDKDWNYINENSVRISGLPYGTFTLHVKGQTQDGQWSKNELSIPIHVLKPFYLQWWFITLVVILLVSVIIYFFRYRTKQLVRTKMALEKTVSERTEQLKRSLDEKEVLLKEIHHRVKNNLEVISSLLELQSDGIEDVKAKAAIAEAQNRVQSIALVHHKLYRSDDIASIEITGFISDLYKQVSAVFIKPGIKVELKINAPETHLGIDTAVPLGLILNELLTNSFKYAVSKEKINNITINLNLQPSNHVLIYRDNGPGMPEGFDLSKSTSFGIKVIKLLTKQLGGVVKYYNDNGAVFEMPFKIQ